MRHFFALLLLASLAGAQEIRRPTADANDAGAHAGCTGIQLGSNSIPLSYDPGVPPTTTYGQQGSASDGNGDSQFAGRVFFGWAPASGPYTALSLNVNLSCTNDHGATHGYCYAQYSTDGGTTWTMLANATGGQAQNTYTAAISASTNFANLQVAVCTDASDAAPLGTVTTTIVDVWDVWTNGTLSGSPGSNSDPSFGFAP